jgi:nicotinamide-nucleotide adenylyltransferase
MESRPSHLFEYDIGVIHGRFQVLHNDHLKYLLAGKKLCNHLVVGITNPDPTVIEEELADTNRSSPLANPLTYYERHQLVRAALIESEVTLEEFTIVPLPISMPDRYRYYVPLDAVFFLSIYDDWGRRKRQYFESLGLKVHVLWEVKHEDKGLSAGDIRMKMAHGKYWNDAVPKSVAVLLKSWGIPERLKNLSRSEP